MTSRLAGLTGATLQTAPTVCHRCIWWQSRSGTVGRQRPLDREDRGRLGRLGDGLLRRRRPGARLDAVRPGRAVPARGRAARRPAVGRRGARHLRVPRRRVEPVGAAVALPRGDRRRTAARERSRPSRTATRKASRATSASTCTRRSSRATSSRTSASRPFARSAMLSSYAWSSAACSQSSRARARRSCRS